MRRLFLIPLAFFMAVMSFPVCSRAAESHGLPFRVDIVEPEGQIGDAGYYHVSAVPGETIQLQASVTNITDRTLEINAVAMNAYSSADGIFYLSPSEVDSQLYGLTDKKYGLAQYMTHAASITLAPGQTQTVDIGVDVPDIDTGTLLGSMRFVTFAGTYDIAGDDSSQLLIDKYQAIDTAIQIDLPKRQASSLSVEDPLFRGETFSLGVKISQLSATIQDGISGAYQVVSEDNAVLFSGDIDAFKMAPMTWLQYIIPWGAKAVEEGAYTLRVTLSHDGETVSFAQPFTIDSETKAQAVDAQARALENDAQPAAQTHDTKDETVPETGMVRAIWPWLIIPGAVVLIVILAAVVRGKSRYKPKHLKTRRSRH
jgi:hypothetical protein